MLRICGNMPITIGLSFRPLVVALKVGEGRRARCHSIKRHPTTVMDEWCIVSGLAAPVTVNNGLRRARGIYHG